MSDEKKEVISEIPSDAVHEESMNFLSEKLMDIIPFIPKVLAILMADYSVLLPIRFRSLRPYDNFDFAPITLTLTDDNRLLTAEGDGLRLRGLDTLPINVVAKHKLKFTDLSWTLRISRESPMASGVSFGITHDNGSFCEIKAHEPGISHETDGIRRFYKNFTAHRYDEPGTVIKLIALPEQGRLLMSFNGEEPVIIFRNIENLLEWRPSIKFRTFQSPFKVDLR